jgi:hypothetical protein
LQAADDPKVRSACQQQCAFRLAQLAEHTPSADALRPSQVSAVAGRETR